MDRVPPWLRDFYTRAFRLADGAYLSGRVAATTKNREVYWRHWCRFTRPLGVEPYLQNTSYRHRIRALSGFAAVVRTGYYGRGRRVQAGTVSQALAAIGKTIALECGTNPTKEPGTTALAPRLDQMLDGWRQEDPPVQKKLPVESDVPEHLAKAALDPAATEKAKAVGDWSLIAFYYLLRIGEYTGGRAAPRARSPTPSRTSSSSRGTRMGARSASPATPQTQTRSSWRRAEPA